MNACSIEEEWLANHKARSISTKVQVQPSPEDNPIKERISKVLIDLEETVKDIPDKYDPSLVKKGKWYFLSLIEPTHLQCFMSFQILKFNRREVGKKVKTNTEN